MLIDEIVKSDLLDLLRAESDQVGRELFVAAGVAGLANAGILAIVNSAAQTAQAQQINFRYLGMFMVVMAIYVLSLRYVFSRTNRIFQGVVDKIRVRLSNKIRHSELAVFDKVSKGDFYNALSQQTLLISESGMFLTAALQASIMICFASVYMAFLSFPAFILTLVLVSAGIWVYQGRQAEAKESIERATEKDVEFFDTVNHALEGFKETKLNEQRAEDLYVDLWTISGALRAIRVKTADLFTDNYVLSQSVFYLVIGAIVFILPRFLTSYAEGLSEITTAIFFIIGPLGMVVSSVQQFTTANVAARKVRSIERAVDELNLWTEDLGDIEPVRPRDSFNEIVLDAVEFSYRGSDNEELFTVGPVSLTLNKGEVVFLIGGNGSGKSTLLYLLTALLKPDFGNVSCDGIDAAEEPSEFRSLFTAIFSDFHLFRKLYGLLGVEPEKVNELLGVMELEEKTQFEDDRFTNLDLSTGQRKRLALLVTLLDDRPVYIFDELAADQDPEFRRFLYEELLRDLKEAGKTIVAVTHDDRYFHTADRILKMEYGRLVDFNSD